jgi:hypothetical protein
MVMTLDFTCRTFYGQGDDAVFHWEDICFCFQVIPVNPAFITSDYQGHEVGIILGLAYKGQCKLTRDCPSALPSEDGAQISLTHVSFAILQLEFSDM